jgi:probable rRNA maturation factor
MKPPRIPRDRVELEIEAPAWSDALPDAAEFVRQAAEAALGGRGAGVMTVLLTDDDTVRELNARFRATDAATNVLAFPAAANPEGAIGDVALAFGVCEREARAQGKPLADHLRHLVIHGVLHLLGYDHQDDAEATAMESRERELLAGLGVADPYAPERASDDGAKDGLGDPSDVATHAVRHG